MAEDIKQNTTVETQTPNLDELNHQLKLLSQESKKTKNKKQKKELTTKISVLKKQINSLIKSNAKNKKQKNKKIKVVSYQLEKRQFKSALLKSMRPYSNTRKRFIYPMIILLGIATSVATFFFVQNTGLFSMGVTGILQGISRLTKTAILNGGNQELADIIYNVMFWLLYFIFNIPLLIFAYFKVSKKFCFLTFTYICSSQIFGLILSFIPTLDSIHIFGDLEFPLHENQISLLPWAVVANPDGSFQSVLPLLFYAGMQAITLGLCYSVLYMVGSSTGGTDIIAFYYAKMKNVSISKILLIFNSISIILSCFLGTICPILISHDIDYDTVNQYFFGSVSKGFQSVFSPNLMFSILIAIISSSIVAVMFPKNKVIKVNIYSQNVEKIKNELFNIGYQQSLTINNTIGGYSWTAEQNIETICLYFELNEIVACVRQVDQDALIVTQKITDIDGKIMVVSR